MSLINIKAGDSITPGLHHASGSAVPTSVAMFLRTAKAMKGKYEPLYLCADQADQLGMELIHLAAMLRKAEEEAKETEEAADEVAA